MSEKEQYYEKFMEILKKEVSDDTVEIDMDTNLMDIGINSFKAIQILVELEVEFDIEFLDYEIGPELFESVKKMYDCFVAHIQEK